MLLIKKACIIKTLLHYYFPSIVTQGNKIDQNIKNEINFGAFKRNILKFKRPSVNTIVNTLNFPANSVYDCHNYVHIKFIATLIHLYGRKFNHSFQEKLLSLSLLCLLLLRNVLKFMSLSNLKKINM